MNLPHLDKYLSFNDKDINYEFAFFKYGDRFLVDIFVNEPNRAEAAWIHDIEDGKIIWMDNVIINITPEAKDYISRVFKLKVFS